MIRSGERRALLIGTELYQDCRYVPLPSVRADLEDLGAVLAERTIGSFQVTRCVNPTAGRMRSAIQEFCAASAQEDLVLIYISGHGIRHPDGEGEGLRFAASVTRARNLISWLVRCKDSSSRSTATPSPSKATGQNA